MEIRVAWRYDLIVINLFAPACTIFIERKKAIDNRSKIERNQRIPRRSVILKNPEIRGVFP